MSSGGVEPDHAEHLRVLRDGGVEFLVIGGLAVAVHGHVRATVDTDVICDPSQRNLKRLSAVLRAIEAQLPGAPPGFDPLTVSALDGANARFETRFGQLHVVQAPKGAAAFSQLRAAALPVEIEPQLIVDVCSYPDLVAMKKATARTQDLADLEALARARS